MSLYLKKYRVSLFFISETADMKHTHTETLCRRLFHVMMAQGASHDSKNTAGARSKTKAQRTYVLQM